METHRVWFKVILNPVLRLIQFRSPNPYVITSVFEMGGGKPPKLLRYGFKRIPRGKR